MAFLINTLEKVQLAFDHAKCDRLDNIGENADLLFARAPSERDLLKKEIAKIGETTRLLVLLEESL